MKYEVAVIHNSERRTHTKKKTWPWIFLVVEEKCGAAGCCHLPIWHSAKNYMKIQWVFRFDLSVMTLQRIEREFRGNKLLHSIPVAIIWERIKSQNRHSSINLTRREEWWVPPPSMFSHVCLLSWSFVSIVCCCCRCCNGACNRYA